MELKLILNKNDSLQYQLYKSSKNKRTKIKKIRNRIIMSILIFLLGIVFYLQNENKMFIVIYTIMAIIVFILYPIYFRILYKRHFSKHIEESFNGKDEQHGKLIFENNYITLKDNESDTEMKININECKEIVEIQTNYFILTGNTSAIILPKNSETSNLVKILEKEHEMKINVELEWKWK
jgi:Na+/proline symporter